MGTDPDIFVQKDTIAKIFDDLDLCCLAVSAVRTRVLDSLSGVEKHICIRYLISPSHPHPIHPEIAPSNHI